MRLMISGTTQAERRAAERHPDYFGRLLTPTNRNSVRWCVESGLPWVADNGCFHGLDEPAFRRMLRKVSGQPGLLWVACPDVVADCDGTLRGFDLWAPKLEAAGLPIAFVGQDGQEDRETPWDRFACLFLGGSTRWKLSEAAWDLASEAKRRGKWVHMGRVNSRRRLEAAYRAGCDSVDGTGMSRWGDRHLEKFVRWLKQIEAQPVLFQ